MEELIRKCRELRLKSWTDNIERVMSDAAQKELGPWGAPLSIC